MNTMRLLMMLAAVAHLGACHYYQERRMANFDLAMQRPSSNENPPVFTNGMIPPDLPSAVPYATVSGDFDGGGSDQSRARALKVKVKEHKFAPDFIIFEPLGANYAGSVSTYVGFGVATSSAVYRPQATASCWRLAPITTGIGWDHNHMVTALSDEARKSGLQEGDTILSIDGSTVTRQARELSQWATRILEKKPGDELKVIWIRPGTGRMEGKFVATSPTPLGPRSSFLDEYENSLRQRGMTR